MDQSFQNQTGIAILLNLVQAVNNLNQTVAKYPTGGGVTSVTGTTNRITSIGGSTPVIDISASYVGQVSITTVGTLSSGAVPASLVTAGTFGAGNYKIATGSLEVGGGIKVDSGFAKIIPNSASSNASISTTHPGGLVQQNRFLYTVDTAGQRVKVYNVADVNGTSGPKNIGQSAVTSDLTNYVDMKIQGNYLYIVTTTTLYVYDVTKQSVPLKLATITTNIVTATQVLVQGQYAFVVNGTAQTIASYDISNPNSILALQSKAVNAATTAPIRVAISNSYLYSINIDTGSNGAELSTVNIVNPKNMVVTNRFDGVGSGYNNATIVDAYATSQYLYTLDQTNGLIVWEISATTAQFNFINVVNTSPSGVFSGVNALTVQDKYAYVCDSGHDSVQVFDVSTPESSIVYISTVQLAGAIQYMNVSNNTIYTSFLAGGSNYYIYATTMNNIQASAIEAGGITSEIIEAKNITVENNLVTGALNVNNSALIGNNISVGGNVVASGPTSVIRLKGYTVATLPTGTQGDTAFVTDALTPTFLGTLVGGGTVTTPCFYNGTNWVGY